MELVVLDVFVVEVEEFVVFMWDDEFVLFEVDVLMFEVIVMVVEYEVVELVVGYVEEFYQEVVVELVVVDVDVKVILFLFVQIGELEEVLYDDGVKEIGLVCISVVLYNVYLQEVDDLICCLGVDFLEWCYEGCMLLSELVLCVVYML